MDDSNTPRRVPAAWVEAIDEGLADVAAGRVFNVVDVIAEFEREDAAALVNAKRTRARRRRAEG
jgi:predicted transcriptional regulator